MSEAFKRPYRQIELRVENKLESSSGNYRGESPMSTEGMQQAKQM